MYECNVTTKLWKDLSNWLKNVIVVINLSIHKIIFNDYQDKAINLIVMIVKQYLYRCRCLKVIPNLKEVLDMIREVKKNRRKHCL